MEKLRIAVCDDDIAALDIIYNAVKGIFFKKGIDFVLNKFTSSEELLTDREKYDFAFLDIEMSGIGGIALAKRLMEINRDCMVFFITNYPIYLDKAFDIRAFRYLSKPIDIERLKSGIESALTITNEKERVLTLTRHKNKMKIDIKISSIIYVETDNRYTHVVTTAFDFLAEENLKTVKNLIENEVSFFAQPQQSYYVNLNYVTKYDIQKVIMTYGNKTYQAEMSRRMYSSFEESFFKFAMEMR